MADKNNIQFTVQVPVILNSAERLEIGYRVKKRIIERTRNDHKDKNNSPFKKYTDEYKKSLDFRNLKSGSAVDLTLTGDMIDALDVVSHGPGFIDMGYSTSSSEAGKVEGNVLGTYGQKFPTGKARDFLGIERKELENIISEVEQADAEERAAIAFLNRPTTEQTINKILKNAGVEEIGEL